MKRIIYLFALIVPIFGMAQFAIGHRTITFNDPGRTGGFGSGGGPGRQIQTEIYYPSTSAGNNTAVANGSFPVITFGHGFVMGWDAYQNIWEHFVPMGYIVALPRTEGSFSPNHNDFALDLRVVNERMKLEGTNGSSPFFQHITSKTAIMGHSMGGGASILAASNYTMATCVVGLAPAETTPSAVSAASNVNLPAMVFSGSSDGVTPPAQHHLPIYNGLASACKTFVSITGGAHCYFANSNFNCDFGEATSSTGISITRTQQQTITQGLLTYYLNAMLKDSCFQLFQTALAGQSGITNMQTCNYSILSATGTPVNPTSGNNGSIDITVSGGTQPYSFNWSNGANTEDIQNLAAGTYSVIITDAQNCKTQLSFTLTGSTGLNGMMQFSDVKVFPNPVTRELFLTLPATENTSLSLRIINGLGAQVYYEKLPKITADQLYSIDFSGFPRGMYLLQLEGAGKMIQQRIVKE